MFVCHNLKFVTKKVPKNNMKNKRKVTSADGANHI